MARRKQQNPRHLETSQELATSLQNGISSGSDSEDDEHVCGRCRAEFPTLSDFIKHKVSCVSKRPVLVFSDIPKNGDIDMCLSNDEENLPSPTNIALNTLLQECDHTKKYAASLSDLPQLVQQLSDTNVTLEQLRNTTVAVAQHGRTMQESQLAALLSNIHLQQVAQLHVIRELQAQILGVPTSPKSIPLVGTAALTPPQSGSESAMGIPAPNGNQPSAPTPARTSTNSGTGTVQTDEISTYEPNTLELLQRHTEQALQNTMAGGSFLLCGVGNSGDLSRLKRSKDSKGEESSSKHRCKFCGKVFGSDSGLQIHLRSHTGERPFKCSVCGSCFSTKGNLKVHFQRHKERRELTDDFQNGGTNHVSVINGDTIPGEIQQNEAIDFTSDKNSPCNLKLVNGPSGSDTPNDISAMSDDSDDISDNADHELAIAEQQYDDEDDRDSDISGMNDNIQESDSINHQAMRQPAFSSPTFTPYFRPTSFAGTLTDNTVCLPPPTSSASGNDAVFHRDPSLYQELLPRIGSNDNSWESLMEVTETSETSKLQKLVDNIEVSDPNQCIICHRVLSCKSALQMHYRTHTGERPFRCKICGRAFTTKGNLKTHMSVHRHKPPSRMLHQCPVCHKQFANSVILQQHIRLHTAVRGVVLPDAMMFPDGKVPTLLPPSYPRPALMPSLVSSSEPPTLTNFEARSQIDNECFQQHCSESVIKSHKADPESSQRLCISSPEGSTSSSGSPPPNIAELPETEDEKPMCLDDTPKTPEIATQKSATSESSSPINMIPGHHSTPINLEKKSSELAYVEMRSPQQKQNVKLTPVSQSEILPVTTSVSLADFSNMKEKDTLNRMSLPLVMNLPNDKPLPMTLPNDCVIPMSLQSDRQIMPSFTSSDFTASLTALENHVKAINSSTTNPLPFPPQLGLGFMPNYLRQDFGFATYHNKERSHAYSPSNSKNSSDVSADESSTPGSVVKSDSPKANPVKSETGALDLTPRGNSGSTIASNRHTTDMKAFTPLAGLPFTPPHLRHGTTCQICFKTFACQSALEIHYRSHTKERPFKCDVCDRGFSTKGNMKQHMLTHKIRDLPPQLFTSNTQAITSISVTPSTVSLCTDLSPQKAEELTKRPPVDAPSPKRSPGQPKHVCEVCHKPFSSGSALQIHMRTHTGVKPFQCNICSRAFTTKGNLKVHMGTHLSSSGTSRRGRRMSLDISPLSLPMGKPGEFPPHPDVFFPYLPPFLNGMAQSQSKMNEISVIQSAGMNRSDVIQSLATVSMSMAPPSFTTSSIRPLSLVTSPSHKQDLKRSDEESQHRSPVRGRELCSPSGRHMSDQQLPMPDRGASWGWKIACNRCNKICSSSAELELHISSEHAKPETPTGIELSAESKT